MGVPRVLRARASERPADGGFTLIELLAVLTIIGVLAAIAVPTFLGQREKAYSTTAKVDLRNLVDLQHEYYLDHNTFGSAHQLAAVLSYRASEGGLATVFWNTSTAFCVASANVNGANDPLAPFAGLGYPFQTFFFDSRDGTITTTQCAQPGGATAQDGGYWDSTGAH